MHVTLRIHVVFVPVLIERSTLLIEHLRFLHAGLCPS